MLNEFGTTAWGKAWLRLAEPVRVTRPDPQLPRARSLARNDRVHELRAAPGRIDALVADDGQRTVSIEFPLWPASPPQLPGGALENPDLPEELVDTLRAGGTPLAPDLDAIVACCDCRTRGPRCRHVLAVLIETARRLDETPVLALTMRGATPPPPLAATGRIAVDTLDPDAFWTSNHRGLD